MSYLVTVVTMCHNNGRYLQECIDSVHSQTYKDIQYIVVDAASSDNTREVMKANQHKIDVAVYFAKDLGLCTSRNAGYMSAQGRYGLTLDADDKLIPDAIAKMVNMMDDKTIICPGIHEFSEITGPALNTVPALGWDTSHTAFLTQNRIFCASMFPMAAFKKIEMYDPELDFLGFEDWDLWIRMTGEGECRVKMLGEVVYLHRGSSSTGHAGSSTTKTILRAEERKAYFKKKHGIDL